MKEKEDGRPEPAVLVSVFHGVDGIREGMGTGEVHIGGDLAHVAVEVAAVPVVQHIAGHLHTEGVAALGAEVEVDLETGEAQVIRYEAAVDCGTPVNPNLARVQAEGGILQGIGMALTENVTYDDRGMPQENSLMQYKIPARNDIGHIHVVFESSYEGTGPFGAKSIGEVVINTPLPAVADAIYHATHKRFYELPITREQIALAGQ